MQNIRSTDTTVERKVMQELKKKKIYFAKHAAIFPGKPDIVFRRKKIAVFIDSDFWHGHSERYIKPKTNPDYWKKKIACNRKRDKQVNAELRGNGWSVVRLWEYDLRHSFEDSFRKILKAIKK